MNPTTTALRALLAAIALCVAAGAAHAQALKIGFVYVGPVGDHGWSYRHNEGRLAIEAALGSKVQTTYVESVSEGADAERVIRQLASSGHGLIFTTSFGFMNPTVKVAKQFARVRFEHATGYKRARNVSTYMARFYEGRYVAGTVAGRVTRSNTIGYVASFPIPEVVRGINAATLALRKVNPAAQVKVVWINSWFDPGKERDAAKVLIDQGADVILQHTDSPAPLQMAEARGVHGVGQASDMSAFAPNAHLTAIVDNWNGYYIERAKAVIEGTWKSQDTWGGFASGMVEMAPYHAKLPPQVIAEAEEIRRAITDGSLHPFTGPIRDQEGGIVVADGEILYDEELLRMNWYVEGVVGRLPQ